jgi:hypothetical protein
LKVHAVYIAPVGNAQWEFLAGGAGRPLLVIFNAASAQVREQLSGNSGA